MSSDVDNVARTLLEEAKRFLEKAKEEDGQEGVTAYLHASLVLGVASLEAHLNSIAEDFFAEKEFSLLEQSLLTESEIQFVDGQFELSNRLKMSRLEDRIEFLFRKFSTHPLDRSVSWWGEFKNGLILRNRLIHPKENPIIELGDIERFLLAIIKLLDALYSTIYKRPYPPANKELSSNMDF